METVTRGCAGRVAARSYSAGTETPAVTVATWNTPCGPGRPGTVSRQASFARNPDPRRPPDPLCMRESHCVHALHAVHPSATTCPHQPRSLLGRQRSFGPTCRSPVAPRPTTSTMAPRWRIVVPVHSRLLAAAPPRIDVCERTPRLPQSSSRLRHARPTRPPQTGRGIDRALARQLPAMASTRTDSRTDRTDYRGPANPIGVHRGPNVRCHSDEAPGPHPTCPSNPIFLMRRQIEVRNLRLKIRHLFKPENDNEGPSLSHSFIRTSSESEKSEKLSDLILLIPYPKGYLIILVLRCFKWKVPKLTQTRR